MKRILHLCADIGSDSHFYDIDPEFEVIKIGEEIGVQNYNPDFKVYGVIANPVCTEFSTANSFSKVGNLEKGMFLVKECIRIIKQCNPQFWVIENPANGRLKDFLGTPKLIYQPWEYGDPWTKKTALWGDFNIPEKTYQHWDDVPKLEGLYTRPGRPKPSLAFMHKSHINCIPEFLRFKGAIKNDADFRSLCSQGFAKAFYESNKVITEEK